MVRTFHVAAQNTVYRVAVETPSPTTRLGQIRSCDLLHALLTTPRWKSLLPPCHSLETLRLRCTKTGRIYELDESILYTPESTVFEVISVLDLSTSDLNTTGPSVEATKVLHGTIAAQKRTIEVLRDELARYREADAEQKRVAQQKETMVDAANRLHQTLSEKVPDFTHLPSIAKQISTFYEILSQVPQEADIIFNEQEDARRTAALDDILRLVEQSTKKLKVKQRTEHQVRYAKLLAQREALLSEIQYLEPLVEALRTREEVTYQVVETEDPTLTLAIKQLQSWEVELTSRIAECERLHSISPTPVVPVADVRALLKEMAYTERDRSIILELNNLFLQLRDALSTCQNK